MKKSKNCSLSDDFSHIYYEKEALEYPISQRILGRYGNSVKIEVEHYKGIFCRPNQDFRLQKSARKLILAVKKDNFLYKGPDVCQNFGNSDFYYTSTMLNCIYDCNYCYLQGMYPSANIVLFVNIEDFFQAAAKKLENGPIYLTVSYDTDLMAFESIVPFTSIWITFAAQHPNLKLEVRTKSANYKAISHLEPVKNVILAWTLSPVIITEMYEKNTPSLDARLSAVQQAMLDGWNVRLCFDPVLKTVNFEDVYGEFLNYVFSMLPAEKVYDIGVGAFRISSEYLKRIRKSRVDTELLYYPFECKDGMSCYSPGIEKEMLGFIYRKVTDYIPANKVFL